jgi:hypothetical protein
VFEKDKRAGGAFRYAGKAPLFQEVAASEASFERYIGDLVAACTRSGVKFRFECDVTDQPQVLAPFDRLVIATGARYRFGLGAIATKMLDWGAARSPPFSQLFSVPMFRDWFYYKGRRGTADYFRQFAERGQTVVAIGDAVRAGKSKDAIASAFEAALLPRPGVRPE